jgi:hypothetical protein
MLKFFVNSVLRIQVPDPEWKSPDPESGKIWIGKGKFRCVDRPSSPEPGAQPGRPDGRPRRAAQQQQPAPGEEAGPRHLGPDDAAGVLRGQQAQCRGGTSAGPEQRGGPTGRVGENPVFFLNPAQWDFLGFWVFLGFLVFFIYLLRRESF